MRTYSGKAVLVTLIVVLGSGLAFWGCGKKSTTAPTTAGRLFIWSLPDSAAVSINGVTQTGMTPITLQNVSFAQHIIRCTKGNYAAVDTVVVHTGRSTPDTAFCWIPGKVNIISDPSNGYVSFKGWRGMTGGGAVGVWTAPSDTYQVTCSLALAGHFKAVDTFRIWADSTAKNYVLPPMASQTAVLYRLQRDTTWRQGNPSGNVASIRTVVWLTDSIGANAVNLQIQLKYSGSLVYTDTASIAYTQGFMITWSRLDSLFPQGSYSQPNTWLVYPHNLLLAEPSWTVTSYYQGMPSGPNVFRAILLPLRKR